jgi:hypothetical protein
MAATSGAVGAGTGTEGEVGWAAENVTNPPEDTTAPAGSPPSPPASRAGEIEQAGEHRPMEEEVPASAAATSPGGGGVILSPSEIQQFAGELATQLFERWQSALQKQFQAELSVRLEAELKHRQHEAHVLREEVQERRALWEGMWSVRHPRGATTDTARWEMEQTMRRQASELAETERQMQDLRERLRDLGGVADSATAIVDVQGEPPESREPAE